MVDLQYSSVSCVFSLLIVDWFHIIVSTGVSCLLVFLNYLVYINPSVDIVSVK